MAPPAASYDEVVYVARPQPATHPDNLAALATLHGLSPAPPDRCRVLEIGCATGGNLLGLAEAYPASTFLGIDPAARQIEIGRQAIASLGLPNLRLEPITTDGLPPDAGPFDYILCHGVYSWVPAAVREGLLAACRRLLAPHGVAYISYNARPGWYLRLPIREMLRHHIRELSSPAEIVAQSRAFAHFLQSNQQDDKPWARLVCADAGEFPGRPDSYVLHEYIEEDNEAFYFHEFVSDARRHGLQYLSEAAAHSPLESLPDGAREALRGQTDVIEVEQYVDFLRGRMFRRTLLVHEEAKVQRPPPLSCLDHLLVAAACITERDVPIPTPEPAAYRNNEGGRVETAFPPLKAALAELIPRYPAAMPWSDLWAATAARLEAAGLPAGEEVRRGVAEWLVLLFRADLITLHASPLPFAPTAGERPRTTRLARKQAREGTPVASLRHRETELDPFALALLPLLDGSRDRMALADEMAARIDPNQGTEAERRSAAAAGVDAALCRIANAALLTA